MVAKRNVLVTGGTGFIGRHLVRRLLERGDRVFVTGNQTPPDGSEFLAHDFQSVIDVTLSKFAAVWHLAAETNTRAADCQQWKVNCHEAHEFLRNCRASGIKSIVYASSCAVYGSAPTPFGEGREPEPLNAYGAAKATLDKLVCKWAVGIRPANVYGPGEEHKGRSASFVSEIVRRTRAGIPLELYPNCSRDLIAVDDVADLFAIAERFAPGVYNASTGTPADYVAVAVEVSKLVNRSVAIDRVPCPFPFEFQEYTAAQTSKTATECFSHGFAWNPVPWRVGLAKYVADGWPIVSAEIPADPSTEPVPL